MNEESTTAASIEAEVVLYITVFPLIIPIIAYLNFRNNVELF
jgi:hypothetical protein